MGCLFLSGAEMATFPSRVLQQLGLYNTAFQQHHPQQRAGQQQQLQCAEISRNSLSRASSVSRDYACDRFKSRF